MFPKHSDTKRVATDVVDQFKETVRVSDAADVTLMFAIDAVQPLLR